MDKLTQGFAVENRVDLAREPDFALGPLKVRPSRCEVEAEGARRPVQRRVMQVLVALARTSSEVVSQRELILRCWGGLSVSEDAIGRCIGQLRRLAGGWADPPFEIETIPGVGYRLVAADRRSRPIRDVPRAAALRPPRRPGAWIAAACSALGLVLLIVYFAHLARRHGEPVIVRSPTIAVLGFQPAEGGAGAPLAASLAGQVTEALSRYDLTVIASPPGSSVRSATAAGADFVVAGRVVEKDHALSVTTDLTDPRNGIVVYSFDTAQPTGGEGDIAGEIANHIALSLDPTKLSNSLNGKLTPVDYTLVARANDGIERWDMAYVVDQTQRLAARHPEDAELQASVAISAIYAAQVAAPSQQPGLLRLGRRSIARAEQLSPDSGLLYDAKSLLANGPMGYATQERLLRRSLAVNPGLHVAYNGLGELLLMVGRNDEAAALIQRSLELDPMSGTVVNAAVADFVKAGRAEQARQVLEREERIWPGDWRTTASEFYVAFYDGTPEQVLAFQQRHAPSKGGAPARIMADLGLDAWRTRDPQAIRRMIAQCFAEMNKTVSQAVGDPTPDLVGPDCVIQMVRLGAMDDAFRFAELAYPDRRNLYPIDSDQWVVHPSLWPDTSWLFWPPMKPFRDDPRFWDVAVRTGLVAYWRSTGSWPDFCAPQLDRCKSLAAAAARAHPARGS